MAQWCHRQGTMQKDSSKLIICLHFMCLMCLHFQTGSLFCQVNKLSPIGACTSCPMSSRFQAHDAGQYSCQPGGAMQLEDSSGLPWGALLNVEFLAGRLLWKCHFFVALNIRGTAMASCV